jgi:hypothetical protein
MKQTLFRFPLVALSLLLVSTLTPFRVDAHEEEWVDVEVVPVDEASPPLVVGEEAGTVESATVVTTRASAPPTAERRSPWRLAVGGLITGIDTRELLEGDPGRFPDKETARGGLVALGYDVTRMIGVTGFVGGVSAQSLDDLRLVAGGDFQFLPFRLPVGSLDLLEFGVLAGGSNLLVSDGDRIGWHVGARLNVNFADTLGLTAAARLNAGHWMAEGGVTARL